MLEDAYAGFFPNKIFDFFMHSILLIYRDAIDTHTAQKGYKLPIEEGVEEDAEEEVDKGTDLDLD